MQEMHDHRKDFDFDADSMSDDALSKVQQCCMVLVSYGIVDY